MTPVGEKPKSKVLQYLAFFIGLAIASYTIINGSAPTIDINNSFATISDLFNQ